MRPATSREVVALETELAKVQWTRVENRDPVKTYNKVELAQLATLAPGVDWKRWLADSGSSGVDYLIVAQPSYLTSFAKLLDRHAAAGVEGVFQWQLLSDAAPYLPKAYVDEQFAFYGTALRGTPENRPRWKRGVRARRRIDRRGAGQALRRAVLPAGEQGAHGRAGAAICSLRTGKASTTLDWMSPETKTKAKAKLAKFIPKIGYPNKWRDYSQADGHDGRPGRQLDARAANSSTGATSPSSASRSTATNGA